MRVVTIILGDNGTDTLMDTEGRKVIVVYANNEATVAEYEDGELLNTTYEHPDDAMAQAYSLMGI